MLIQLPFQNQHNWQFIGNPPTKLHHTPANKRMNRQTSTQHNFPKMEKCNNALIQINNSPPWQGLEPLPSRHDPEREVIHQLDRATTQQKTCAQFYVELCGLVGLALFILFIPGVAVVRVLVREYNLPKRTLNHVNASVGCRSWNTTLLPVPKGMRGSPSFS